MPISTMRVREESGVHLAAGGTGLAPRLGAGRTPVLPARVLADPRVREELWRASVLEGWSSLLCRVPWDLFVTLTNDPKRYARSGPESWLSSWGWFTSEWYLQEAIARGRASREGERVKGPHVNAWRHGKGRPTWALCLEPHEDGRLHAHALVRHPSWCSRLDWGVGQRLWSEARGICRFEVPRSREHVCSYVAKYILKGGGEGLSLSPNFVAPSMTSC